MPTIPAGKPSGQPKPPEPRPQLPHQARAWAESFGADAARYDRARPRYPDALIERIAAASPGPEVLDVGCGTGIAARQFHAAGCRVLGVEVDPRMAEQARRHGLAVEVAKFEDWDPAGRGFDAVIAAQAWHWVDAEAGARQAARALRPGGRLAVFWNVARPEPALAEAFAEVYRAAVPDNPIFGRGAAARAGSGTGARSDSDSGYAAFSARAADGMRACGAFAESERWEFGWERTYTRDEWLDVVPTTGGHSLFSPAELDRVLTGIGAAVDDAGGAFTVRYTAEVCTASLLPG
jgi:SAM-dependent methyltransferase